MNKDQLLKFKGQAVLYQANIMGGDKDVREGTISDLSQSGRYVQISALGSVVWFATDDITVLETLTPAAAPPTTAAAPEAPKAPAPPEAPKTVKL